MLYKQFAASLKRPNVVESVRSYNQIIEQTDDGVVYINKLKTEYATVKEAKEFVKEQHMSEQLEEQVSKEVYEELSDQTVAAIIKEYHNVRVTDTLVESYTQLASSRMFSIDPVVHEIRKLNKLDSVVEGKLHYVLDDESVIAINESTQSKLNKLLHGHDDVVDYMRESADNFLRVIEQIKV